MAKTLTIAGVSMRLSKQVTENEQKILAAIERAASDGAQFLLTPEGALSGYWADFDRKEVAQAVKRVTRHAKDAGVGLALGTCYTEVEGGTEYRYNQIRFYTPAGRYLGFHAKILRCSTLDHPGTGEMLSFTEGILRVFKWNGICFGGLICNDFWATPGCTTMPNPYLPWRLKQMGAQVIFHAVNAGEGDHYKAFHESNVELWARALQVYVVEVNVAPREGVITNDVSGVIGPDGARLMKAPETGEQYFTYTLQL